jgi:hypothetical protein
MLILLLCSYCISSHVCLDMGKCDGGSRVETSFTVLLFEPGRSAFVLYVLWKVWFGPPLAVSSAKNPTSKHMRCKHWRHIICKRSRCAPSHLSLPGIPNKRSCQRARVCSMSFLFLFFCLSLFSGGLQKTKRGGKGWIAERRRDSLSLLRLNAFKSFSFER